MSCHVRLVEAWELQWRHLGVVIAIVVLVVVSREPWWCVRPLRLHVGGVLWRGCPLGLSRRCIRSGRTLLRAMLGPVGSEYRLPICDVIRVAPLLRSVEGWGSEARCGTPVLPCGMADTSSL